MRGRWGCALAVAGAVLVGCRTVVVEGGAQKGPFILGSTVLVSPIDEEGVATGAVFTTSTRSDRGDFKVRANLGGKDAAEVSATGFYFNEVTGEVSDAQLTLRAFVAPDGGDTFVNSLTHLAHLRARGLYEAGGSSDPPEQAIARSDEEVRDALGLLVPSGMGPSDELDILEGSTSEAAYLLTVSCLLAQAGMDRVAGTGSSPDAATQEILNELALDLEPDGEFGDAARAVLDEALVGMDGQQCMEGLVGRLASLGDADPQVGDVFTILDFDGDGLADALDPDADGDGVDASEEGLVDGTAHDFVAAVVDNRVGENGGYVWLLFHEDIQTGRIREAPHLLQTEAGPLSGVVDVAAYYQGGPLYALRADGTVWYWGLSGTTSLHPTAPTNVVALHHADSDDVLALTSTNEVWHLTGAEAVESTLFKGAVDISQSTIPEWGVWLDAGGDVFVASTLFDEEHPDTEVPGVARVKGLEGITIIDVAMSADEEAVLLSDTGALLTVRLDTSAMATPIDGPPGVQRLDDPDFIVYAITESGIWYKAGLAPFQELQPDVAVTGGVGTTWLRDMPVHLLLGADGNAYLLDELEFETHQIRIPR